MVSAATGLLVEAVQEDERTSAPAEDAGLGAVGWLLLTVFLLLIPVLVAVMLRLQLKERLSWLPGRAWLWARTALPDAGSSGHCAGGSSPRPNPTAAWCLTARSAPSPPDGS